MPARTAAKRHFLKRPGSGDESIPEGPGTPEPTPSVVTDTASGTSSVSDWSERLRAGDERALEMIIREFHPPLYAYILRLTGNSDIVEDLIQKLFWRLWQARTTLRPGANLRVYLYVAARHHVIDYVRSTKHNRSVFDETDEVQPWVEDHTQNPLTDIANAELAEALATAVRSLPKRCREVWELSRDHGLSYAEIAEVTGVSLNTVKTQMARAMCVLRTAVAPYV